MLLLFNRMVTEEKLLEVEIEQGMKHGQEISFVAEGLCALIIININIINNNSY